MKLVPPPELHFFGQDGFLSVGRHFRKLFIELGGLQANSAVLDVGCGVGRMAAQPTQYLIPPGRYDGFDIVRRGVEWCESGISSRYPHFRFRTADLSNKAYNPEGRSAAASFRFPYADESFDFVFLTSVFTHLLPAEVENYLSEIARVLRTGGQSFVTYFLINHESEQALQTRALPECRFDCQRGEYRTTNPDIPEAAVAFPEEWIRSLYARSGLQIREPIHFGNWCERSDTASYQDIVVATKPARAI